MNPSRLTERVAFDAPFKKPDGRGGTEEGWAEDAVAVKRWANFLYLKGGETVQAARLQGKQLVVVTVRSSVAALGITTDWRMRNLKTQEQYNIRSGPVPTDDRLYLEFTVESGVSL